MLSKSDFRQIQRLLTTLMGAEVILMQILKTRLPKDKPLREFISTVRILR